MVNFLDSLKQKSKWLFYLVLFLLALPILGAILLSVFSPLVRAYLTSSAQKLMGKTKQRDDELKKEISEIQDKISKIDGEIESVDNRIKTVQDKVDEDWHKGWKKNE